MVKIKLYQTKPTRFRVLSMFKKVSKRLVSSHTAPGLHKLWNPAIPYWRTWSKFGERHPGSLKIGERLASCGVLFAGLAHF